jgi:flagellar biosynthetic protein FliO
VYFSVTGFKKKIVIILIIAALGNGALIVRTVHSDAKDTASEKAASESDQSGLGVETEHGGLFEKDSGFAGESDYLPNQGEFFLRALLAVVFVVILGVAAIYVSKKLLPQIAKVPGKQIRIIETVHLGPRKAVHLIDIGHRRFLIGSTNENVTKLADLNDSFAGLSVQEAICD